MSHGSGAFSFTVDADSHGRSGKIQVGSLEVTVVQGTGGGPTPPDLPSGPSEPTDTDISYYHADAIGSVRLITDGSGAEVTQYDYLPSGIET